MTIMSGDVGGAAATTTTTPNFNTQERKTIVDEANKAAEEFTKLFYKTIEQKPHRASLLYLDTSVLIWDGNPHTQLDAIKKFYENIPSLTYHLLSLDSQPLPKEAVGGQKTFMITTGGTCRVGGDVVEHRNFSQSFVITAEGDKWKIASDVFRSQMHPTHT